MTLEEYGAWFIGFSDQIPCPPGGAHWALIKTRVNDIDGMATSAAAYLALSRQDVALFGDLQDFDPIQAFEALGRRDSATLSRALCPSTEG